MNVTLNIYFFAISLETRPLAVLYAPPPQKKNIYTYLRLIAIERGANAVPRHEHTAPSDH